MTGTPALIRALCADEHTHALALAVLAERPDPPGTLDGALGHADDIERRLAEAAWRRRRAPRFTADDEQTRKDSAR